MAAAASLGQIGDSRAAYPLIQALKKETDSWARSADADAIVSVLKNADYQVRKNASEALFGTQVTNEAMAELNKEGWQPTQ